MKKNFDSQRASSMLLPVAVAGMLAGFNSGCTVEKSEEPSGSTAKAVAEKTADAVVAAKHACKGMNACKGMGGCSSGDAGCAGKNSCKGKGGCTVPIAH